MRRTAELALLLGGVLLLGLVGYRVLSYAAFQSHPEWLAAPPKQSPGAFLRRRLLRRIYPSVSLRVLGRLEIVRLGMSTLVVEGDDDASLSLAAGHVPGTPAIGAFGNSVIAGHRDTSFQPLRKIRLGDRIRIDTDKSYIYVVSSLRIVDPDDISVLRSGEKSTLTMITCYPFRYVGPAPKRFVVTARKVER